MRTVSHVNPLFDDRQCGFHQLSASPCQLEPPSFGVLGSILDIVSIPNQLFNSKIGEHICLLSPQLLVGSQRADPGSSATISEARVCNAPLSGTAARKTSTCCRRTYTV